MTAAGGSGELRVAAVDLGATSGRVVVATVGPQRLDLEEVHRFPNSAVRAGGGLFWDALHLFAEILEGLRLAGRGGEVHGIGIDSWAVDHGLLDREGHLVGNPWSHRDPRTDGVARCAAERVPAAEQYAVTGLAELPFNTVYQLLAPRGRVALEAAQTLLLLPDLFGYWLTGRTGAERTNASTTGLYDCRRGEWSSSLCERLGVPTHLLPDLRDPGERVGELRPDVAERTGLPERTPVLAVGSHDTASAVVAVPAASAETAYLSSGTWSLIGLELDEPVLSEEARRGGFTNEGGVDGTVRFLKNVMGLWVLSESVRTWSEAGETDHDLHSLLAQAVESPALRTVVDIDDPRLLPPGDMPERVRSLALEAGEPLPRTAVEVVRTVLDSLALAYRRHLRAAGDLAGRRVEVLHVVGGGSRNALLCALTADACGVDVLAGPTEAAALGNALVQARSLGADLPDLSAMRDLVRRTHDLDRYEPALGLDWVEAELRLPQG